MTTPTITTPRCATSGCGLTGDVLDVSTVRVTGWVQVRRASQPDRSARWYCGPVCAALSVAGAEVEVAVRARIAADLDQAELAYSQRPDPTGIWTARCQGIAAARRVAVPPLLAADEASCHACGCTEDDPCPGGCAWVAGTVATCSACAEPAGLCSTAGCGTPADLWDGSDPALWGWICIQVAGAEAPLRWVCSPWCATAVIHRAGADLTATAVAESTTTTAFGGADVQSR